MKKKPSGRWAKPWGQKSRKLTVERMIEFYLAHLEARRAAGEYGDETLADVSHSLGVFTQRFGRKQVGKLRQFEFTSWLDRHPEWKSNHTRKRRMAAILRAFAWAEEEQLITRNPFRKPSWMKLPVRPRRAALPSEYIRLMRVAYPPLRRALFFLRRTGARTCEMRNIRWPDVDLKAGVIILREHKTARATAKPRDRIIALEPCVLRLIRNLHKRRLPGEEHVFLNDTRTPWNRYVFAHAFRRDCKRAGLPSDFTGYTIRHMFCTLAIQAGLPDRQIADLMGHSGTELISWYAHNTTSTEYLRRIAAKAMNRKRTEGNSNNV